MIMGRKTFDSIGRPLPGRTTIVVTRDKNLQLEGCLIVHSMPAAIAACAQDDEIFIVGGAEIYTQSLRFAKTIYATEIQQDIEGDVHFPHFDVCEWKEISRDKHIQNVPQPLDFHFVTYEKR